MPRGGENPIIISVPICTPTSVSPPSLSLIFFLKERRVTTSISHSCCPGKGTLLGLAAPLALLPPVRLLTLWVQGYLFPSCSDSTHIHKLCLGDGLLRTLMDPHCLFLTGTGVGGSQQPLAHLTPESDFGLLRRPCPVPSEVTFPGDLTEPLLLPLEARTGCPER